MFNTFASFFVNSFLVVLESTISFVLASKPIEFSKKGTNLELHSLLKIKTFKNNKVIAEYSIIVFLFNVLKLENNRIIKLIAVPNSSVVEPFKKQTKK